MTVGEYFEASIPGYPIGTLGSVLDGAAFSPILAEPKLQALSLDDEIADHLDDAEWMSSLKYALSTLYYSMSGVLSGGSRSEQVGDVRASLSGFQVTSADREYYRKKADALREELGYDVEDDVKETGGMFDAIGLRGR